MSLRRTSWESHGPWSSPADAGLCTSDPKPAGGKVHRCCCRQPHACPCHLPLLRPLFSATLQSQHAARLLAPLSSLTSSLSLAPFPSSYLHHPSPPTPPRVPPLQGPWRQLQPERAHPSWFAFKRASGARRRRARPSHPQKLVRVIPRSLPQFPFGTSRFIAPTAEVFGIPLISEHRLRSYAGDVI